MSDSFSGSLSCIILIFLIGIVIVVLILDRKKSRPRQNPTQASRSNINQSVPLSGTLQKTTYRPNSAPVSNIAIRFKDISPTTNTNNSLSFEDLHDALTGASLDRSLGLYQCDNCKVFYHNESFTVLREVNNSQCVSCQSKLIYRVNNVTPSKFSQDFEPEVITLKNYMDYVGHVVTFEGLVYTVYESRRGNDYAVMFENKRWVAGFKLVFFTGNVTKLGGVSFVNSLRGKRVRVRGLIVQHPKFGYEIVVSDKQMILAVK